jgi:sugar phosphate isomerase/epimerase
VTRRTLISLPLAIPPALSGAPPAAGLPRIAVFSKHLQWLDVPAMALFAKEAGFDAIDLTVRKGGHVEPANALAELPRAAAAIRAQGLALAMVTTAISSATDPGARDILRACAETGVKFYRWGGWKYDRTRALEPQIADFRSKTKALAALNKQFGVCGVYHTHSGRADFGASIWDIAACLDGLEPAAIGVNFDIGHATIEGGLGGWMNSLQRSGPYLRGIAVKDFLWTRNAKGEWQPEWKPVGEGMVRLREFFALAQAKQFAGPIQVHYEYAIGGAEHGNRRIDWTPDQVRNAMSRDLIRVREALG